MEQVTVSDQSSADGGGVGVDVAEILRVIRRRKWWVLACAVLVTGAMVAGTMRQPKVYAARAQVVIAPALPKVLANDLAVDNVAEQARTERVFTNTQFKTITSRTVVTDVIQRLQLASNADFLETYELTGIHDEEKLAKAIEGVLLSNTSVGPEKGTRIVNIRVEDQDPYRAAKLANAYGDAYIHHTLRQRLDKTNEASKWLDKRVAEFAERLEDAEKRLYEFKRDNMLVSVSLEDRQNITGARLKILTEKLVETRTELIRLRAERSVLELEPKGDGAPGDVPDVGNSPVIAELRTALVTLDKKRADMATRYGPKHPVMVGLEEQIKETRGQLDKEVQREVAAIDRRIAALEAAQSGLGDEMSSEKRQAIALNNLALEYAKLSRTFGTTKETYQRLLTRQTETALSGRLDKFNFVDWFERAEPRLAPVRPSVLKNGLLGAALGLLLGLLIAVATVLLDNTVHQQQDVEELLRLPFLGLLPRIADEERERVKALAGYNRNRDLYVVQNPKSAVAECARSVRTNLLFMGADRELNKLLLTSAGTSEGKTTTSIALAVTMAQAGNRVLLMDTDLRKPRLHRTFGVSGKVGITSLLVDAAVKGEAIKKTEVVGLDFLPCGPLPPNPADLLHSERFAELLEELASEYDRVLLDSPPVGVVTDAAILSQLVDGALLVIQANQTTKESARRARRRLVDVDANIVGVVLNDVDIDAGGQSNQYYYYRYGYGHDTDDEAQAKA